MIIIRRSLEVNIDIITTCTECGSVVGSDTTEKENTLYVNIDPCENCLDNARDAGFGEAAYNISTCPS